jgi:hypothetical protein
MSFDSTPILLFILLLIIIIILFRKSNERTIIKSPETIQINKIILPSTAKVHYDKGYPMIVGRNPVCYRINRNNYPFYENKFY